MKIIIDLGGGLDVCFNGQKGFNIEINEGAKMSDLVLHLKTICNPKKIEFFVQQDQLRPGILVLINDVDWELEEKEQYQLSNNDRVSFISTLHGG